jgi:hypothetical protein
MRRFVGKIETNMEGSACEFEFEVEDDANEEQIEAEAREAAFQLVEWLYREVK